MKFLIALAVAAMALGAAPTAEATIPAFCTDHQEYLTGPAAALHVKGNIYKTACAAGPGNGGLSSINLARRGQS
jgi:hypothetical protein